MLMQLLHQFKNGTVDLQAQREVATFVDLQVFFGETRSSHPLPAGASWLCAEEGSKHFVMTKRFDP